jgi:hypothetical protein
MDTDRTPTLGAAATRWPRSGRTARRRGGRWRGWALGETTLGRGCGCVALCLTSHVCTTDVCVVLDPRCRMSLSAVLFMAAVVLFGLTIGFSGHPGPTVVGPCLYLFSLYSWCAYGLPLPFPDVLREYEPCYLILLRQEAYRVDAFTHAYLAFVVVGALATTGLYLWVWHLFSPAMAGLNLSAHVAMWASMAVAEAYSLAEARARPFRPNRDADFSGPYTDSEF